MFNCDCTVYTSELQVSKRHDWLFQAKTTKSLRGLYGLHTFRHQG